MKTTTGLDRRARTHEANRDAWIAEGWKMAEYEDEAAFESIEIKHGAEVAEHGVDIENIKARGNSSLQHLKHVEQNLRDRRFDPAEHLKQIAHGKLDLAYAAILLGLNATL